MARNDLSSAAVPGPCIAAGPIEEYLAVVQKGLIGPARWRSEVIVELRDGLVDAADAHRRAMGSSDERAVVAQFGSPQEVLAGFLANGAARLARRVAMGVLASGPLAATAWAAAMATSGVAPWQSGLAGPWRVLPGVGVVLAVALPAALLVLAVAGRAGHRWGAARPQLAPTAAGLAAGACAVGDVVMLGAVGVWQLATAGPTVWSVLVVAAGFSGFRCLLAGCAARRCLAARAWLV